MSKQDHQPRERERTATHRTTTGFRISEQRWAVLPPLLPVPVTTQRFGGGRPRVADRACADAICCVLRTGCPWPARDQTEGCAHATAPERLHAGGEAGVFRTLGQAGVQPLEELCGIEWDWLARARDGALTKAPLGGEKPGPPPTDRGQSGVTRSVLTAGQGVPRGRVVEGAHRHGMKVVRPTMDSRVVARPAPTAARAQGMCLDAGDDSDAGYPSVQAFGVTAPVRPRGEAAQAIKHAAGVTARRWVVERAHAWMTRLRRLLVRWDQQPEQYRALRHFAWGFMAFRAAGLFG